MWRRISTLDRPWSAPYAFLADRTSGQLAECLLDGPQSSVFAQAVNRLPTEQAILYALASGKLSGRIAECSAKPAPVPEGTVS